MEDGNRDVDDSLIRKLEEALRPIELFEKHRITISLAEAIDQGKDPYAIAKWLLDNGYFPGNPLVDLFIMHFYPTAEERRKS